MMKNLTTAKNYSQKTRYLFNKDIANWKLIDNKDCSSKAQIQALLEKHNACKEVQYILKAPQSNMTALQLEYKDIRKKYKALIDSATNKKDKKELRDKRDFEVYNASQNAKETKRIRKIQKNLEVEKNKIEKGIENDNNLNLENNRFIVTLELKEVIDRDRQEHKKSLLETTETVETVETLDKSTKNYINIMLMLNKNKRVENFDILEGIASAKIERQCADSKESAFLKRQINSIKKQIEKQWYSKVKKPNGFLQKLYNTEIIDKTEKQKILWQIKRSYTKEELKKQLKKYKEALKSLPKLPCLFSTNWVSCVNLLETFNIATGKTGLIRDTEKATLMIENTIDKMDVEVKENINAWLVSSIQNNLENKMYYLQESYNKTQKVTRDRTKFSRDNSDLKKQARIQLKALELDTKEKLLQH